MHECPIICLARATFSEEELSRAVSTKVALEEMPSIFFRGNYNWYKEHNDTI